MAKSSRKGARKKQRKSRKNEKPLSLHGVSFLKAVDVLLATKPAARKSKKKA